MTTQTTSSVTVLAALFAAAYDRLGQPAFTLTVVPNIWLAESASAAGGAVVAVRADGLDSEASVLRLHRALDACEQAQQAPAALVLARGGEPEDRAATLQAVEDLAVEQQPRLVVLSGIDIAPAEMLGGLLEYASERLVRTVLLDCP